MKLDPVSDIDMLLMIGKGRGRICHFVYRHAKVNDKYMKYYN